MKDCIVWIIMSEHLAFEQFFIERQTSDFHKILFTLLTIMYGLHSVGEKNIA